MWFSFYSIFIYTMNDCYAFGLRPKKIENQEKISLKQNVSYFLW